MDKKIIIIVTLFLCTIAILFLLNRFGPAQIMLIPFGLILLSLVFFSRGILIFLTMLCLVVAQSPMKALQPAATQLRWVFLSLFVFHIFGDIFLGRTVRKIKIFDILAIIFIIYAFLSSFYSPFPSLSQQRATTVLALYISVFWIIWKYAYDQKPEKVIYLILQTALFIFTISCLMIFISPSQVMLEGRFHGLFQNPNSIGISSAILLPLSLWWFLETKKKYALFLFLLILIALLLSASRNSINAVIISMGYFIYTRSRKYRPLVLFSSMTLVLILTWVVQTLGRHSFEVYYRTETIPTLGGRIEIWPYAWDLFINRPIFGYGFGVEDKLFPLKYAVFQTPRSLSQPLGYIHNSYLGICLQLGIVGLILLYGPLFILLFKELFSRPDTKMSLLRYALQASLISGLLCSLFESWIYSVGNAQVFPFWIIVMLLVFYRHQDKDRAIPEGT